VKPTYVKPKVVVSKCIEFDYCRYNGQKVHSDIVRDLKPYVDFVAVCPEVEIGLGVPRESIRIIKQKDRFRLVQPATRKDLTKKLLDYSTSFFNGLNNVDGFILKSRSPSCGIKDVRIYPNEGKASPIAKNSGLFGQQVLNRFPQRAIEDEARLKNSRIREHFLTKLFTLARFRNMKILKSLKELVRFHSENKLLLMGYSQKQLKELGI
jgi:uncharacterized protein YbbK (DUF523 family)